MRHSEGFHDTSLTHSFPVHPFSTHFSGGKGWTGNEWVNLESWSSNSRQL